MKEFFLSIANMYLPVGAAFLIVAMQSKGITAIGALIVGLGFTFYGLYALGEAYSKVKEQDKMADLHFRLLIDEIKGLRQDIRGDSNDAYLSKPIK